jgi:hypothetical protein
MFAGLPPSSSELSERKKHCSAISSCRSAARTSRIRRRRRRSQSKERLCSILTYCSLRSLRLALVSRCLPRSLADEERVCSLVRPEQRRASLAPCGGARFPTLAARDCRLLAAQHRAVFDCSLPLAAMFAGLPAVFVGAVGTEKHCSAISSCRSAARTSRIRRAIPDARSSRHSGLVNRTPL